ncbi:hypothetical protein ACJMK2_017838 [Sinanodonta woodiana]|uniref:Carboxylesterase type B domain-containing protein n=1 Tax=Sinanodonta woodiana TaxID=1069815 RepID=A0ABD3UDL0_SINWO
MGQRLLHYHCFYILCNVSLLLFSGSTSQSIPFPRMGKTVKTVYGTLRGLRREFATNSSLRPVEAYFGLQYAILKGNMLRFMPPKNPIDRFDFIKKFVKYEPTCPQRKVTEKEFSLLLHHKDLSYIRRIMEYTKNKTEECLRLNLYVPLQGKL